jgi:hypothetical protein
MKTGDGCRTFSRNSNGVTSNTAATLERHLVVLQRAIFSVFKHQTFNLKRFTHLQQAARELTSLPAQDGENHGHGAGHPFGSHLVLICLCNIFCMFGSACSGC